MKPGRPIRPVLAGSALLLVVGLILLGYQAPAGVPWVESAASDVRSVRSSSTPAGPTPSARPIGGPTEAGVPDDTARTGVRRTPASIPPAEQRPVPRRVTITGIGTLPIRPVGVAADGAMALPDDPGELGWYRFGSEPGADRGSAVLAGHVDSREYGIGPLADLDRLRRGDPITVITTAGAIRYTVDRISYERRAGLPVGELFDRAGPPRLVIITCGGPYTPGAGYRDNLIITAAPAGE